MDILSMIAEDPNLSPAFRVALLKNMSQADHAEALREKAEAWANEARLDELAERAALRESGWGRQAP